MIRKAVVDRFEEEYAVLLLDEGKEKLILLRSQLPEAAQEGSWLQVSFADEPAEPQDLAEPQEPVEPQDLGESPPHADLQGPAGTDEAPASRGLAEPAFPLIISIILDEEETTQVRRRIADKLNRLRRGDHLSD